MSYEKTADIVVSALYARRDSQGGKLSREDMKQVVLSCLQEMDKPVAKGPMQLRAEALMRRRLTTPLTKAEKRAFAGSKAAITATTEEDWLALEAFYAAPQAETFARKDLATLINNWNGEIDRAKAWAQKNKTTQPEKKNSITWI